MQQCEVGGYQDSRICMHIRRRMLPVKGCSSRMVGRLSATLLHPRTAAGIYTPDMPAGCTLRSMPTFFFVIYSTKAANTLLV